jgi:hypothetical protein
MFFLKKKRKILIAGFAMRSKMWAREQPLDVEIWGMNESHQFLSRADSWFQLHPRDWKEAKYEENTGESVAEENKGTYGRGKLHYEFLKSCGVPVYMNDPDESIPTAVQFPIDEITERWGALDKWGKLHPYLTSTPAWMMALACLQEVDEIRLSGVELAVGTEYFMQRPCFEYWIGIALGMGINVVFPPQGTSILHAPLYPIDDPVPWMPPSDLKEAYADSKVLMLKDDGTELEIANARTKE